MGTLRGISVICTASIALLSLRLLAGEIPGTPNPVVRAEWDAKLQAFYARWPSGENVPDFVVYNMAGNEVKLTDYRGKVVILDFWASWCSPCEAALPHVQALAREYKDQGVVVLALATSDTRANFEKFVTGNRDKYPDIVWTHDKAERADERVSKRLFGLVGIPTHFVIDRAGKVVDAVFGYIEGELVLDAALSRAGIEVDPGIVARGSADKEKRGSQSFW